MSLPFRVIAATFTALILFAGKAFAQESPATSATAAARDSGNSGTAVVTGEARDHEPPDNARPGLYYFNKGARAFKNRQFAFAIEMYEIAASYAYKPAQYNLAVIFAQGQGVATDLPRALAWATLAAERSDEHYAAARNAILAASTAQQIAEAERLLNGLIPKYADETAMKRAKSRWKDSRFAATGSHLGFVGGLKVGDPGSARGSSQKHEVADTTSASLGATVSEVLGGKQIDGSLVYRELRETDNPYDPRFVERNGTVKVGELESKSDTPPASTGESDKH